MATARPSKMLINATADSASSPILPNSNSTSYPRQGEIPWKGLWFIVLIIEETRQKSGKAIQGRDTLEGFMVYCSYYYHHHYYHYY
jgi:hypothetical protein